MASKAADSETGVTLSPKGADVEVPPYPKYLSLVTLEILTVPSAVIPDRCIYRAGRKPLIFKDVSATAALVSRASLV
jgi:hypothetical protein